MINIKLCVKNKNWGSEGGAACLYGTNALFYKTIPCLYFIREWCGSYIGCIKNKPMSLKIMHVRKEDNLSRLHFFFLNVCLPACLFCDNEQRGRPRKESGLFVQGNQTETEYKC